MLRTKTGRGRRSGTSRRQLLKCGLLAVGGLSVPDVLRWRAAASGQRSPETAVIFVQLGGGASHFETYDPKPEAPAEYRGAFQAIPTSVPGVRFCELMPRQARLMDELVVVRSVQHHEASHIALHMVETGYFLQDSRNALKGEMPSTGAVVSRSRSRRADGLPAFVSIPRPHAYSSASYLGGRHNAFDVNDDPNADEFQVANLSLAAGMTPERLHDRQALLRSLDETQRLLDLDSDTAALDAFQRQALEMVTGERVRHAFDIDREAATVRDRYGRNPFGQRLLLARRLVEAGVPFAVVRTFDWDDHQELPPKMQARAPQYDTGLAALIEDLGERGLRRDVLVVAMGEFGRTPRVNKDAGRDHWPAVMSVLLAGGRWPSGQVIGATDDKGAAVIGSPYPPQSVLAMMYRHLGIDPAATFNDFSGRPRHILEERQPIRELI